MKPEVVYEVCSARKSGPYPNKSYLDDGCTKNKNKCRQRRRKAFDCDVESADSVTFAAHIDEENDVTIPSERTPLSIVTWINHAENGQTVRQHTKSDPDLVALRTPPLKKGQVVYLAQV